MYRPHGRYRYIGGVVSTIFSTGNRLFIDTIVFIVCTELARRPRPTRLRNPKFTRTHQLNQSGHSNRWIRTRL